MGKSPFKTFGFWADTTVVIAWTVYAVVWWVMDRDVPYIIFLYACIVAVVSNLQLIAYRWYALTDKEDGR